jgi:hypothetical protein
MAGAIVVLMTGAAAAQLPMGLSLQHDKPKATPEEIARQKAIDDAYKAATKKIPDQQQAADPWSDVRPAPNPLPTPKIKQSTASKTKQ